MTADDMEPFTLVEETQRPGPYHLFDDVVSLGSGKTADHDLQYITALREANPDMIVTASPVYNMPLRAFAAAGFAICELDTETDSFASWRGFNPPRLRQNRGTLAESVHFAKFHYQWNHEDFILYTVLNMQYILKERRDGEHVYGPSKATDALMQTVGDWLLSDQEVVWVFDLYWQRSKQLYNEVMKATWDKVCRTKLAVRPWAELSAGHPRRIDQKGPSFGHEQVLLFQAGLRGPGSTVETWLAVPWTSRKRQDHLDQGVSHSDEAVKRDEAIKRELC